MHGLGHKIPGTPGTSCIIEDCKQYTIRTYAAGTCYFSPQTYRLDQGFWYEKLVLSKKITFVYQSTNLLLRGCLMFGPGDAGSLATKKLMFIWSNAFLQSSCLTQSTDTMQAQQALRPAACHSHSPVFLSLLFELTELQNVSNFKEFTLIAHIPFQAVIKKS